MPRTEVDAVSFGVTFLGVKDIYSSDNSSPQTTEINAAHRAPTLMKWVNIAAAESVGLILLMTSTAPRGHKRWPFMGGVLALAITYGQYLYAKASGLKSTEPGTETFATGKHPEGKRTTTQLPGQHRTFNSGRAAARPR